MEFKKQYIFIIFLPFIIMLGIFLVLYISLITWMIVYGISTDWANGAITGVISCSIMALVSVVTVLALCQWVTIDEEKIELKTLFRGVYLSFKINDIYKIEKITGAKGIVQWEIYGSTPQKQPRKINKISFWVTKKSEKVLRHFITNPDVWT